MFYPIFIEKGDDETAWGVIVPDLPGCFSAGDSLDEAILNATKAITLWVEGAIEQGIKVPLPSSLDKLKEQEDYKNSEFIWGFAKVDPALFDEKAERVNITLPRRVLARIDARAKELGETRSGYITRIAISQ